MYNNVDPKSASAKAWVGSRSFAGIAGSNPTGSMGVSLFECCALSLRQAVHSPRRVILSVVCVSVVVKPRL